MITQKRLKELLTYNPDTGLFTINVRTRYKKPGDVVGHLSEYGYLRFVLDGKNYRLHRLAWLYLYGYNPKQLDHINRNKTDNRICNLREVSHQENNKNRGIGANNKLGILGVCLRNNCNKWQAQITVNRKIIYLGLFDNLFDAACARKSAEIKYGFHQNHGVNMR